MPGAYYAEPIADFLRGEPEYILGVLAANSQFAIEDLQRNAWLDQIEILKDQLSGLDEGYLLFEYSIPRMGKRVDVVLLMAGVVFVIEFKVGDTRHTAHALGQALDYALDLKNFHEQSHTRRIVPVVVATESDVVDTTLTWFPDKVAAPVKANKHSLCRVLAQVRGSVSEPSIDTAEWRDSGYKPTPTIIEAAQALYRGHSVKEISRSDAGAINLSHTAEAISEVIERSKSGKHKAICFVTGVPGAGKTLAGLNIANERLKVDENEHTVFLSGNGPLVTVLREALARDDRERARESGKPLTKTAALTSAKAFIQNIHHFRDAYHGTSRAPLERVVVFDEAQRAWTQRQTAAFMKRKRNIPGFSLSEPELLISIMDRHPDWAVIVCLIGGGQEINTGEAGLLEWFRAIRNRYQHWQVYCPPNLADDEYMAEQTVESFVRAEQVNVNARLHLAVSVRSYRAESISGMVKAILDIDQEYAKLLLQVTREKYPVVLTRDLDQAKRWLRTKARGSERYGLLANSGALRLRPIGVNVRADIDVVHWFLNSKSDVRSSYFLEEVATEFDVQGLELDWAGIVWDGDLRFDNVSWQYHAFTGTNWNNVRDVERRRYLKNAYRVLLTRARQGMVIVVPYGNPDDATRQPEYYDGTYQYLSQIGFEVL